MYLHEELPHSSHSLHLRLSLEGENSCCRTLSYTIAGSISTGTENLPEVSQSSKQNMATSFPQQLLAASFLLFLLLILENEDL